MQIAINQPRPRHWSVLAIWMSMFGRLIGIIVGMMLGTLIADDHSQLLVVRDAAGMERPVKTKADWAERVSQIRSNMQRVMGPLPNASEAVPLDLQVVSDVHLANVSRKKIYYRPEAGDRVPAWLLMPHTATGGNKKAAMLCLHQTTKIGKDEPAGLGGLESLHYAQELAERGFVCLVPDYPSFGDYDYDFNRRGSPYASGSMKAIWNNIRGIDLLASLPEVDASRIGAIGHSLGGHNALFTAVFDERIQAVVTSCGFTPFHDYYRGNLMGWSSDRYMPRIRSLYENHPDKVPFDFYEVIAAIAPRGVYSCSPIHDSNFDVVGVRKVFEKADGVYQLFVDANATKDGAPRLKLSTPDAAHEFPRSEREAAYAWLDKVFQATATEQKND